MAASDSGTACRPEPITTTSAEPAVPTQFHPGITNYQAIAPANAGVSADAALLMTYVIDSTRWSISLDEDRIAAAGAVHQRPADHDRRDVQLAATIWRQP